MKEYKKIGFIEVWGWYYNAGEEWRGTGIFLPLYLVGLVIISSWYVGPNIIYFLLAMVILYAMGVIVRIGPYRFHANTVLMLAVMLYSGLVGTAYVWVGNGFFMVYPITPLWVELEKWWKGYLIAFIVVFILDVIASFKDEECNVIVYTVPILMLLKGLVPIICMIHLAYIPLLLMVAGIFLDFVHSIGDKYKGVIGGAGLADYLIYGPIVETLTAILYEAFVNVTIPNNPAVPHLKECYALLGKFQ